MAPVVPLVMPGTVLPVADETVGIVGRAKIPTELAVGNTLVVDTATAGLTPRLPISLDPSGIPVRATPPGAVGDVGVDDEAKLLEPEPHIPDNPDVSNIPEVVDIPDVADPEDVDIPDIAMAPELAEAAGAVPTAIPPPSYVAVDPYMLDGEVPRVEHVPLLVIEVVPVTMGPGPTPGEAISVEPSGIPTGPAVEPVVMPSGEVAPTVGVGLATPPTCAMAVWQMTSGERTAAMNENFTCTLRFRNISPGAKPSGIDQSAVAAQEASGPHGLLPSERKIRFLLAGRWTARSACSIKYAFIVVARFRRRSNRARPGIQLRDPKGLCTSPLEPKNKFN
jgi:hypothetical protein